MPCIICTKEARLTDRILLVDLALARRHLYENEFFCNWEYNYVCRRCYRSDSWRRMRGNMVGASLSLGLRFGMVYLATLTAISFISKYRYQGPVTEWGPVIFAAATTLLFYRWFATIMTGLAVLTMVVFGSIYGVAYSDSVSFLPHMGAVVQRERMKQDDWARKRAPAPPTPSAVPADGSTTAPATPAPPTTRPDPIRLAEEAKDRARAARIEWALNLLERWLPLDVRMGREALVRALWLSLRAFALLYATIVLLTFVLAPMYRVLRQWGRDRRAVR